MMKLMLGQMLTSSFQMVNSFFVLSCCFLLLFSCSGYPQATKCDTVYRIVDEMPMYKNSYKDLVDDLNKISITQGCAFEELQQVIWTIDKKGKIASVEVVGPTKDICKNVVIEHAKTLTAWTPGKNKGKTVCVKVVYAIHMRPR